MLKNFYLKIIKRKTNAHDQEGIFVKRYDTIDIFTAYSVIFSRGQDTLIRKGTYIKKSSIKSFSLEKTKLVGE